eukprot:GHVH01007592.1.p1 GENE.GHVH01007592.1~~GHVH01007592.1.p1  ORF type:complete len:334 (-),score=54.62 GHVH01007592.1:449-1450(-)
MVKKGRGNEVLAIVARERVEWMKQCNRIVELENYRDEYMSKLDSSEKALQRSLDTHDELKKRNKLLTNKLQYLNKDFEKKVCINSFSLIEQNHDVNSQIAPNGDSSPAIDQLDSIEEELFDESVATYPASSPYRQRGRGRGRVVTKPTMATQKRRISANRSVSATYAAPISPVKDAIATQVVAMPSELPSALSPRTCTPPLSVSTPKVLSQQEAESPLVEREAIDVDDLAIDVDDLVDQPSLTEFNNRDGNTTSNTDFPLTIELGMSSAVDDDLLSDLSSGSECGEENGRENQKVEEPPQWSTPAVRLKPPAKAKKRKRVCNWSSTNVKRTNL